MKSDKLLRAEDVADLLGLRLPTVRRMILERRMPTVKIGRSVRIPIEAVDRFISDGWRESVAK